MPLFPLHEVHHRVPKNPLSLSSFQYIYYNFYVLPFF
nr:MAG TPA: hypothetical protein [Caudoviricetes sp.]